MGDPVNQPVEIGDGTWIVSHSSGRVISFLELLLPREEIFDSNEEAGSNRGSRSAYIDSVFRSARRLKTKLAVAGQRYGQTALQSQVAPTDT